MNFNPRAAIWHWPGTTLLLSALEALSRISWPNKNRPGSSENETTCVDSKSECSHRQNWNPQALFFCQRWCLPLREVSCVFLCCLLALMSELPRAPLPWGVHCVVNIAASPRLSESTLIRQRIRAAPLLFPSKGLVVGIPSWEFLLL